MYFERLEQLNNIYNNYSVLSRLFNVNRSTIKRWFDKSRIPKRSLTTSLKRKINFQLKKITDLSSKQSIRFDNIDQFLNDVLYKLRIMRIRYTRFKCVLVFRFCSSGELRHKSTSNFYTRRFDAIDILREEILNILEVYDLVDVCSANSFSSECVLVDSYIMFF